MQTSDGAAERGGQAGHIGEEARVDALDVLRDLVDWRLTPARWDEQVGPLVDAMADAWATGDAVAFVKATADLELASPVRVIKIGSTEGAPPPDPVRERRNHLVHSLGETVQPGRDVDARPDNNQKDDKLH